MTYSSYDVQNGEKQNENDEFTLFVSGDRLFLKGTGSYDMMGDIETEGVLVRLDYEDFVIMTGEKEALKISKSDIDGMMNMMGNGNQSSGSPPEADIGIESTGRTETIMGYDCEEYRFEDKDNPGEYAMLWMTDQIEINWGMLAEPWGDSVEHMNSGDVPFSAIFKEGLLPLRIEGYEGDELVNVVEATDVSETSEAKAMVQVPSGVEVLSFQDYLFKKMSEN